MSKRLRREAREAKRAAAARAAAAAQADAEAAAQAPIDRANGVAISVSPQTAPDTNSLHGNESRDTKARVNSPNKAQHKVVKTANDDTPMESAGATPRNQTQSINAQQLKLHQVISNGDETPVASDAIAGVTGADLDLTSSESSGDELSHCFAPMAADREPNDSILAAVANCYYRIAPVKSASVDPNASAKPSHRSRSRQTANGKRDDATTPSGGAKPNPSHFASLALSDYGTLDSLLCPLRAPSVLDDWSPRQIALFECGICALGKNFYSISKVLLQSQKSTSECIDFYYKCWKKSKHYAQWKEVGHASKRRRKTANSEQQPADSLIQNANSLLPIFD